MSLPTGITPITVSGKFLRPNGTPADGQIRFIPSITAAAPGAVLPISPLIVPLDDAGAFTVILAATDDADWAAAGWTYTVTEQIRGAKEREYSITVPAASPGGALDLATVIPVGLVGAVSPYLLVAGGTLKGSLDLESSFAGGSNTSDSTRRITLHSHQRAQKLADDGVTPAHFGEVLRAVLERDDAKAMHAWVEDYTGAGPRTVAWVGAHGKSNDGASWHNHLSFEVPDQTGTLQTMMEIPFAVWNTPNGYGIATADQYVRVVTRLIAGGTLFREGPAGTNRDINLGSTDGSNVGGKDAFRRWSLRVNATAEAGSNVGSDFAIWRRADDGGLTGSPALFIQRSTGAIGVNIADATLPGARVDVVESGARPAVRAQITTSSTVNFAAFDAVLGAVANRYLNAQISGEAATRLTVFGDGRHEWGDGTNARDTNLYRKAANQLGTDDAVFLGNVSEPATPTGGGVLYVQSGALKYKGSSGTVTTLGNA